MRKQERLGSYVTIIKEESGMAPATPRIGFIGFGEVAYHMALGLEEAGLKDKAAYCNGGRNKPPYSEEFRQRARTVGVELVSTLEDLARKSDLLFSLVNGEVSLEVARQVSPFLGSHQLYVDFNNSVPQAKEMAALAVNATGASFVDVMIVGPAILQKHRIAVWASGNGVEQFRKIMSEYGMKIEAISAKAGAASTLKTIWEVYTKGLQGLIWETMLAAHKAGVDLKAHPFPPVKYGDEVINFTISEFLFWHSGIHAARKSGELGLIGEELRRLGVEPMITEAASKRLAKVAEFGLQKNFGGAMPSEPSRTLLEALDQIGRAHV